MLMGSVSAYLFYLGSNDEKHFCNRDKKTDESRLKICIII